MTALILRKWLYMVMSLFVMTTLTFIFMKFIPGDPFAQEQALSEEIYRSIYSYYGLDRPLLIQYFHYLKELMTFNLGPSMVYQEYSVNGIIANSFPKSALLGIEALAIAIPIGLFFGILSSLSQGSKLDVVIQILAILAISIPNFILATLLQYVYGIQLNILPVARFETFFHTILPALSLAALPAAFIARLTRNKMIDEMQLAYITTARAKGLPEYLIIWRHALRNILIPLISYIGPVAASILTGSFIVEKIYSVPGLGFWFVSGVLNRDYPLIMGIAVFYCALLLLISLLVDVIALLLDPRLLETQRRLSEEK